MNLDWTPGAGISAYPAISGFDGESAEAAEFDTPPVLQGICDLIQDSVHELVDVLRVEMAVASVDQFDQFGFKHGVDVR